MALGIRRGEVRIGRVVGGVPGEVDPGIALRAADRAEVEERLPGLVEDRRVGRDRQRSIRIGDPDRWSGSTRRSFSERRRAKQVTGVTP